MFQSRIFIAFVTLAIVAMIQGGVAWWSIHVATDNVHRGRVASDLLTGFLELSTNKQNLRIWLSQALLDAGADPRQRDNLQNEIGLTLKNLTLLTELAHQHDSRPHAAQEYKARLGTLKLLEENLAQLRLALADVQPLPKSTDASVAWRAVNDAFEAFDALEGLDLRPLVAENIGRERAALARERAAADASLALVKTLALGTTLSTALAAALLALYFSHALRRPFGDLSAGAQALQQGDLDYRMPDSHDDEFSRFGRSVNTMASELKQHRNREVAARQQLEELVQIRTNELQHALNTLQQLDLRRRQLFSDISHELRTPTTAIRGEAEITLRGREKPVDEYKAALARIVTISQQLGMVIDDLLTMARSDIDMLALDRQPIQVELALQDALEHLSTAAEQRHIQFSTAITPAQVLGDSQRLRQTFIVLLDNAICYSNPDSHIRLSANLEQHDKDGLCWHLSIQDEGIGISTHELEHIFERHFRSELARKHRPNGTGLGLSIAVALIRAHNGHIQINSQLGQGTTVHLWLPCYDASTPTQVNL
ncbi:MAG: ATP-binding protein [Pseudomonadota bacterium]|nr:ATP-binding protein [Pseudomonadota bacterium]